MKKLLKKFFNDIVNEINELSDSDLKKLESGDYKISIKVTKIASKTKTSETLSDEQISFVVSLLKECKDRESGYKVLIDNLKNRKHLEAFAKSIDVFVMKQDNVDKIREKIIEGTIGAVLRSNAIQGDKT